MTLQALNAWATVRTQLDTLLGGLTEQQWLAPSACAGWRVRDVIAHLSESARAPFDPLPPPAAALPLPSNRERQHDIEVDRRRRWPLARVLDEYQTFVPKLVDLMAALQLEPAASQPVTVPGLGVYPAHSLVNGLVFDYYCHMRHDLLTPAGPIADTPPAPDHDSVYSAVVWMMLGLPQMQGDSLSSTVTAPVTLRLTGPGASEWTVSRPDPAGELLVTEGGGGEVLVTSSAHAFIAWGTQRRPWRADCTIDGKTSLAIPLLDALNIV